jgi:hypothetical protein
MANFMLQANIAGYRWRAPYILAGLPGIIIGLLLIFTVKDPRLVFSNYGTVVLFSHPLQSSVCSPVVGGRYSSSVLVFSLTLAIVW